MPVYHMVWIKFYPGITPARIAQHVKALAGLKQMVPGILEAKVGENFSDRAAEYTHGLLVVFPDRAALAAYLPHPAHMKVAAPLLADADVMAMDIEA